jgi:hypothetical protein
VAKRLTSRQRALPDLIVEANKRLQAVQDCKLGAWRDIEDAACFLAQLLRADVQPDWDAYPLGTKRYDRLKLDRRKGSK